MSARKRVKHTKEKRSMEECLLDKAWRINNLYQIQLEDDETGEAGAIVPLVLRDEQHRLLEERHNRNFIPKCRKLGLSTIIVIDYLDSCIFADADAPMKCAHIDKKDADAIKKLNMAKLAWDRGPYHPDPGIADIWRAIHKHNPMIARSDHCLKWANGSEQRSTTSVTGDTPNKLHISEFGPIAAQFPNRAAEIKRGSINAVAKGGVIDIETTMEGGPVGVCFEFFQLALRTVDQKHWGIMEWKMFFIPWMSHPSYILPGQKPKKQSTADYFADIQGRYGVKVPLDKQAWYEVKFEEQGWEMFTQFPTVIDECLMVGGVMAFFDGPGLLWQRMMIAPYGAGQYDFKYGDIIVQGDIGNYDGRTAIFMEKPVKLSPFIIFEGPIDGCKYILPNDFCVGKQAINSKKERDTNAFMVIRDGYIDLDRIYHPPQVVACCQADDRSITTETIRRVVALSIFYGDCLVMPEINNKDDIAHRLMAAGVRNMWRQGLQGADNAMPGTVKTSEVFGWLTHDTKQGGGTRGQMLDHMQALTMQQGWICTFPWILGQMGTFHVNEDGKPEATLGNHDDWVTSTAMGLFGLGHATKYVGRESKVVNDYRIAYQRANVDKRRV